MIIRRFGTWLLMLAPWLGAGCGELVPAEVIPTPWTAGGAISETGGAPPATSTCAEGTTQCDGNCVSLATSPTNCGACGTTCDATRTCVAGQCVCQGNLTSCDGFCVNLAVDGNNCGACGNVCAGQVCSAGACSNECTTGTACGTSCVDLESDSRNCGACGSECPAGLVCQGGDCTCPAGQMSCDGACVDVQTSSAHCGGCNIACDALSACVGGTCEPVGTGGTGAVGPLSDSGGTPSGSGGTRFGGSGGSQLGGSETGGAALGGRATGGASSGSGGGSTGPYSVDDGGYVTACSWHGFAWTGAGPDNVSTIQPAGFSALTAGARLCASGTVGADPDYAGYAMIGVNVGQDNTGADDPPNAAIVPQGTGLYVSVTNNASNSLRIQIQDALGGDNADHRWCALYNGPGVIPWTRFNTACWDDSGAAYAREPINAVLVAVPGDNTNDTSFNFCVDEIRPQGDPACSN